MSKLGTHGEKPYHEKEHPDIPEPFPPGYCYLCGNVAKYSCERCGKSICTDHLMKPPRMQWTFRRSVGPRFYGGNSWRRYEQNGNMTVCPTCTPVILEQNAREQSKDRAAQRKRQISGGIMLAIVAAMLLFAIWAEMPNAPGHQHISRATPAIQQNR